MQPTRSHLSPQSSHIVLPSMNYHQTQYQPLVLFGFLALSLYQWFWSLNVYAITWTIRLIYLFIFPILQLVIAPKHPKISFGNVPIRLPLELRLQYITFKHSRSPENLKLKKKKMLYY